MDIADFKPEIINQLCLDLGISQSKLARASDVNTTCVSRFLRGEGSVTLPTAQAMAAASDQFIDKHKDNAR